MTSGTVAPAPKQPPDSPGSAVERRVVDLFGFTIDALSMDETVARVEVLVAEGGVHQHVSVNVDKVVKARRDPELRSIINAADIVSADGQPIVWASRMLGRPLPQRVAGVDLMERLIANSARTGHRLYFLGARDEIVRRVIDRVRRDHPGAMIAGGRGGYWSPDEEAEVARSIAEAAPDLLFLALPSPAKERFFNRWKATIGAALMMGVGGSFDVYAGAVPRAPMTVQRAGLEWLYRLAQEPRRMWRRYLVDDLRFIPIVVAEWRRLRAASNPNSRTVAARSTRFDPSRLGVPTRRPLRILLVANLYPSPEHPSFGTFIASRAEALQRTGAAVEVVAIRDAGVHHRVAMKYLRLLVAVFRVGVTAAARGRRFDIVEAHIAYPTGWLAWPVAVLHRAPLVLFVHGADVADVSRRGRMHGLAARVIFGRAARVVVNSRYMATDLARTIQVGAERLVIQSPGIDFALFRGDATTPPEARRSGLLFVGRLHDQKGVEVLVSAVGALAARGRSLSLTIIGDGPLRGRLDAIERSGELPIRVLGPLPPPAVAAAMRAAEVVVVPSTYQEPLGLVAIEAMAAGAVVVASATGGLVETVVDGRTGLLCPPGDAERLAAAIEQAMETDAVNETRSNLAGGAMAFAETHDVDGIARNSVAAYRKLLRERRRC